MLFVSSYRSSLVLFFVFMLAFALSSNASPIASTASVWQRWDQQIPVGFDYLNGGGNPYQDLALIVQFNGPNSRSFQSYGFWDGGNVFRVRAAFPATSNWTWKVLSCTGLIGKNSQGQAQPCSSDTTLMGQTGTVNVAPDNSGNPLYKNGFLRTSGRYLTYTDNPTLRFYWQGDTAWAAISLEGQKRLTQNGRIPGQVTSTWKNYVDDRKSRGFTVLQVGAAIAWQQPPSDNKKTTCPALKDLELGDSSVFYPAPDTFAFDQLPPPAGKSCVGAIPNICSRWRADYWQEVDSMIEYANEQGLVILMAGVADPSDRGGCHFSQSYPRTSDSLTFVRNLAARLAGNHVMFSVNFDDYLATTLEGNDSTLGTVRSTTMAVGPMLKTVVPKHLVVDHIAGSSILNDYTDFQLSGWLDFQLFQSGHALNVPVACPGRFGSTWQAKQQCAVSRAIDLTKGLRAALPLKPAVNGEGGYDTPDSGALPPDNRYGMRHTAYASLLGGAAGFTAGVNGRPPLASITRWDRPDTLFGSDHTTGGITDMQATRSIFEGVFLGGTASWGEFSSATAALTEVTASPGSSDTLPGERRILTGVKGNILLTLVPNNPVVNVIGGLGFQCQTWTAEWRDVRGLKAPTILCPKPITKTQFSIPGTACSNRTQGDQFGFCDWLMYMKRPQASGLALNAIGPDGTYLQVTVVEPTDQSSEGQQEDGQLMAQAIAADGTPVSAQASVGLDGTSKYGQPTVVSDVPQGVYWIVWEAEAGDDGTTDVFARQVDSAGTPLGDPFQVNQWTPDSQYSPFVLLDQAGTATIVWTSMGQDGDQGGIFARRFQLDGSPIGDEFQVNVLSSGDQESALGSVDSSGNVTIGWRSGDNTIKARMYSANGSSLTSEISVNQTIQGRDELIKLEAVASGGFTAHWEAYSVDDQLLGRYVRTFDAAGSPFGDEAVETPQ